MTFTPEIGQMVSGPAWSSTPTPDYVTDGLERLDAAYARHREANVNPHARTSNYGGTIKTETFTLIAYCWCDGERSGHEDGCPPNFSHPASGFNATWYKHARRGQSCNRPITEDEWATIEADCLTAIAALEPAYVVLITGSREFGLDVFDRKRLLPDWKTVPSPQRDAMVAAFRSARERAGSRPLVIRHGAAAGADSLAGALAFNAGVITDVWPALWRRPDGDAGTGYDLELARQMKNVYDSSKPYRREAGPERNSAMVAAGADECLAFLAIGAGNRGTRHCASAASRAGIPVTMVEA